MKIALRAASVLYLSLVGSQIAAAQTYNVLHYFHATDGRKPLSSLISDSSGYLYGTTSGGGDFAWGTVYKVNIATGRLTVLHSFDNSSGDGTTPESELLRDRAGNLYGTTSEGGAHGFGTIFKLDRQRIETVLYSFNGDPDGGRPTSGLILDQAGNLYGTTGQGGVHGNGTVFKLDTSGAETILHSFSGADGDFPNGTLLSNGGYLYGVTNAGGAFGHGTIFRLNMTTGKGTLLHHFSYTDGAAPYAGLVRDGHGDLYGTTSSGGTNGRGTVFKLDSSGKLTTLYNFKGASADDGEDPLAPVILDAAGNIYGTTWIGGADPSGNGTVFKLDTAGTETILHSFTESDGDNPHSGLYMDSAGVLYGTLADSISPGLIYTITP
jgi:uncharacterized repeat protein (TIGR03803 family)